MDNPNIYGLNPDEFAQLAEVTDISAANELQYIQTHKKPDQITVICSGKTEAVRVWKAGHSAIHVTSADEFAEAWDAVSCCSLGKVLTTLDRIETQKLQRIIENNPRQDSEFIPGGWKIAISDDQTETQAAIAKAAGTRTRSRGFKPIEFLKLSEIEDEKLEFLWYPYIPRGEITALFAKAGTGKTTFVCGLIASLSCAQAFPGEDPNELYKRKPIKSLFISKEEKASSLKAKLIQSGVAEDYCFVAGIEQTIRQEKNIFSDKLDKDPGFVLVGRELPDLIERTGAELVIVDPWHECLPDGIDMNKLTDVGALLSRVQSIAQFYNIAIVLISHERKGNKDGDTNDAAIGSGAYINKARSALEVVNESSDQDDPYRLVFHTKSNAVKRGKTIRYEIVSSDERNSRAGLRWCGFSPLTAEHKAEAARRRMTMDEIAAEKFSEVIPVKAWIEKKTKGHDNEDLRFSFEQLQKEIDTKTARPAALLRAAACLDDMKDYTIRTVNVYVRESGAKKRGFSVRHSVKAQVALTEN